MVCVRENERERGGGVVGFVYRINIVLWSPVCILGRPLLWSECSMFTLRVCVRLSFRLSEHMVYVPSLCSLLHFVRSVCCVRAWMC